MYKKQSRYPGRREPIHAGNEKNEKAAYYVDSVLRSAVLLAVKAQRIDLLTNLDKPVENLFIAEDTTVALRKIKWKLFPALTPKLDVPFLVERTNEMYFGFKNASG